MGHRNLGRSMGSQDAALYLTPILRRIGPHRHLRRMQQAFLEPVEWFLVQLADHRIDDAFRIPFLEQTARRAQEETAIGGMGIARISVPRLNFGRRFGDQPVGRIIVGQLVKDVERLQRGAGDDCPAKVRSQLDDRRLAPRRRDFLGKIQCHLGPGDIVIRTTQRAAFQFLQLRKVELVAHRKAGGRIEDARIDLMIAHPFQILGKARFAGRDIALAIAHQQVEKRPQRMPNQAHIRLERGIEGRHDVDVLTRPGACHRTVGPGITRQQIAIDHADAEIEQRQDPFGRVGVIGLGLILAQAGAHLVECLGHQLGAGRIGDVLEGVDEAFLDRCPDHQIDDPVDRLAADFARHGVPPCPRSSGAAAKLSTPLRSALAKLPASDGSSNRGCR